MKTEETYETLAACRPDLIVVVAYSKILPQRVLDLPPPWLHQRARVPSAAVSGGGPYSVAVLNGDAEAG